MEKKKSYVGLSRAEVEESRRKHGDNVLTPKQKESLFMKFLGKFADPLIIILIIAGILSLGISFYEFFGLDEGTVVFFEPVGIFVAILLATGLSFFFEMKADKEFALLNQVNDDEPVRVIRDGNTQEVPKRDVVVGDIVVIGTGDEIPADGVLLEAVSLNVDESTLTGEPLCHKTTEESLFDSNATYPSDHVMRGTKVMEGHGIFKVEAVGDCTENGKVFKEAQIDNSVKTPLNEQLEGLGALITKCSYVCAGLILIGKLLGFFHYEALSFIVIIPTVIFFYLLMFRFNKFSTNVKIVCTVLFFAVLIGCTLYVFETLRAGENIAVLLAYILDTLMIAVTLIVVSVPEGLPMAVTLSLAYSMRRMLKTNNLVRKMHACETMGATTVICTDKTGTLTQNQMRVYATNFYSLNGDQKLSDDEVSNFIMEGMAVNSTASLDLSDPEHPKAVGNPTEGALMLWLKSQGVDYMSMRQNAEVVDEIPFTTENKYMATVVKSPVAGKRVVYVKGAPEIVASKCATICGGVSRKEIDSQLLAYQNQAMRTLGFAYQVLEDGDKAIDDGKLVASGLNFLGITAISDPVRADVPAAVAECMDAGISIKIVTGDTPGTAKEIGRQIGLWKDTDTDENILTGPEFEKLTDEELLERVEKLKIIPRARPLDKKRLVEALQKRGQVVAVTGDGTNDAPALKAAHVGLSMGDGTSVAKEASDITIIDNSFSSIARAVMWGRSLYLNIRRFVLFQMTVNVVACLIVLVGAFIGTENPLTVTQMLWVNLIMDTFAAMALASLPPSQRVMKDKPRDRRAFIISKEMAWNIVGTGGVFFVVLVAILYFFQRADVTSLACASSYVMNSADNHLSAYELSLFFTIFVMMQFWNMFNARAFATGRSAFHFAGCTGFGLIAVLILVGQVIIVSFGGLMFNVTPLSLTDWIIVIAATSLVLFAGEGVRLVKKFTSRQ